MVNFHLKHSSFGGFIAIWPLVHHVFWLSSTSWCLPSCYLTQALEIPDWLTVGKPIAPQAWNVGLLLPLHKPSQDSWNWINPIILVHTSSLDGCFVVWIQERWEDSRQWSRGWWLIWAARQSKSHFPLQICRQACTAAAEANSEAVDPLNCYYTNTKMCARKLKLTRMAPKPTIKHYKAVSIQAIFWNVKKGA